MTDDDMEQIIIDAGSAYTAGRYEEALKLYDTAIEARPTNAILFANKAAILLRLDRAELAVHSADRAIELDPNWAKAYYRRGEALRRLNSLLPAVVALSEGAALGPSNNLIVDALIDVAQQFFDNFSLKRLENIGLERDLFTVLTMIGQELASMRHLREATTVLTRALSLSSPSRRLRESALSALASVHFSLGEYHKATFYYEKQLDIRLQQEGHSPADVYENVATSAELTGNYALALSHRKNRLKGDTSKCIEELSGVDPPSEEEAIKVADAIVACHIKEGSIQDAIEYLNELLKTSTENRHQKLFGHTCFLLAREHIRNGRPHSAIRLAKRILRLARTTSDSCLERAGLQLMATIYEEQDDLQSASVLLQQYLEVSGVTVVESVNALLRLAAIADRTSADPLMALTKAVELADVSGNLDLVALARSALLRHLAQKDANDQQISKLLALQKELLKSTISVTSRSLIFEDMAMCEKGETSGMDELFLQKHAGSFSWSRA
ncbi:hypothetical protein Q1695_015952 [Nippostrongylus brasiliensis]|nr:hypothetical protein Q1695_015952 [Nippostrongylus brasiliensis]